MDVGPAFLREDFSMSAGANVKAPPDRLDDLRSCSAGFYDKRSATG